MAVRPPPAILTLLWALIFINFAHSNAVSASFLLSTDIIHLVPECARHCFVSFIATNFVGASCGTTASLDCLCGERGVGGLTIGEGALQCIEAAKLVGVCDADEQDGSLYRDERRLMMVNRG